jgi:hypothetical protein
MFKKMTLALLVSVDLFIANITQSLAESLQHPTIIYPSICKINIDGRNFNCDTFVMGSLKDYSGNIKLCYNDYSYCLILVFSGGQWEKMANSERFQIDSISLQENLSVEDVGYVNMYCVVSVDGFACAGNLRNNNRPIMIYAK